MDQVYVNKMSSKKESGAQRRKRQKLEEEKTKSDAIQAKNVFIALRHNDDSNERPCILETIQSSAIYTTFSTTNETIRNIRESNINLSCYSSPMTSADHSESTDNSLVVDVSQEIYTNVSERVQDSIEADDLMITDDLINPASDVNESTSREFNVNGESQPIPEYLLKKDIGFLTFDQFVQRPILSPKIIEDIVLNLPDMQN